MKRWCWCVAFVFAFGASLHAEATKPDVPKLPAFEFHAPLPALASKAAAAGIPLENLETAVKRTSALQPGEQIVALVSLSQKGALTQWILEVTCVELTAQEEAMPPLRTWTLFTNAGTEVFLGGERAALSVRVLGPCVRGKAGSGREVSARVLVNATFLGLGMDRGCEAVLSVNAAKAKDPTLESFAWGARQKPYSEEEVSKGRKLAERLGLTPERERAVVGTAPALIEFFGVMSRTPGLEEILKKVIDVPWWAIIKKGGDASVQISPQFRFAEKISAEPFGVGGRELYAMPFQLTIAGQRALVGKLAVTDPHPPLAASAGIVGVAAWGPDGDGPRVSLQVIAARNGTVASGEK